MKRPYCGAEIENKQPFRGKRYHVMALFETPVNFKVTKTLEFFNETVF